MSPQRGLAPVPPAPPASGSRQYRRYWIAGAATLVLVAAAGARFAARDREKPAPGPLDNYQRDVETVEQEYRRFHGRLLRDPELEHEFRISVDLVSKRDYKGAIEALEAVAKGAGVPAIFHDLGSLYAAVGDRARAIQAYREVLARDAGYRPVRDSIDRLRWMGSGEAEPLKREMEPNNSPVVANLIGFGAPVEGELSAGDTDTFKFITPPAPRDIVRLEISNPTRSIELGVRVSDDGPKAESANLTVSPGEALTRYLAREPNLPMYLQIWGAHNTTGPYRVTLTALKAFDAYEPNDDIFNARRIEPGGRIEANIMDSDDTDYYAFQSPRTGDVTIEIENQSDSLIPALTTFNAERRNTGFGPDVRTRGASLHHTMHVEEHQTYYLQVWPQALSFGKYAMTVH